MLLPTFMSCVLVPGNRCIVLNAPGVVDVNTVGATLSGLVDAAPLAEMDAESVVLLMCLMPPPVLAALGLGFSRTTGTETPTISAIIKAIARPNTTLNMNVLLEQRHLPVGRMFWKGKSSSSTSSSNEARRGMPSL